MLNTPIIIIIIVSLIIVVGFICLVRIILCLEKKLNESTFKANENKEKIVEDVSNSASDTIISHDLKSKNFNGKSETINTNIIQELSTQVIEKEDKMDAIDVDKMVNSYLSKSDNSGKEDVNDYHEANIMKVNKTDGIQYYPVDPNRMSISGADQLNKLDIVIEKAPIDKALRNEYVEKKR